MISLWLGQDCNEKAFFHRKNTFFNCYYHARYSKAIKCGLKWHKKAVSSKNMLNLCLRFVERGPNHCQMPWFFGWPKPMISLWLGQDCNAKTFFTGNETFLTAVIMQDVQVHENVG